MRSGKRLSFAAAAALLLAVRSANSQGQVLFTTAADWGGSTLSNDPTQTGYLGWGTRGFDYLTTGQPSTSFGAPEDLQFNGPDLDGSTINGVGNYNSNNDNARNGSPDPNFTGTAPILYGGKTSPGGSMTIPSFQGGYDTVTTGEMSEGGTVSGDNAFINALTQNGANKGYLKISYTNGTASGATVLPNDYFLVAFLIYGNVVSGGSYASGQVEARNGVAGNPAIGNYGGAMGGYTINHGTFLTSYIPYDLSGAWTPQASPFLQFGLILNASAGYANIGNVVIDDIEALPSSNSFSMWSRPGSGSWATANVWSGGLSNSNLVKSGTPQVAGDEASFLGDTSNGNTTVVGIKNPATITLDGDRTVGNINFQNTNSYTLAQGTGGKLVLDNGTFSANITDALGSHSITAPVVLNSSVTINLFHGTDTFTMAGNISGPGGITRNGSGTVTLSGTNTYAGATTVNSGLVNIASAGSLPATTALTVGSTGNTPTLSFASTIGRVAVSSLTVNPGGLIDLANNGLAVNYGTPAAGPAQVAAVLAALTTGYNSAGAHWTGPGLSSSAAAANPNKFALGYVDGNTDAGSTASANQVLIRYTLAGDANLDGTVGFPDLLAVAQNYGSTGKDWAHGNFNYDPTGAVGFPDLLNVAQNYGASSGVSNGSGGGFSSAFELTSSLTTIPEPSGITLLAVGAAGLLSRRKRQK